MNKTKVMKRSLKNISVIVCMVLAFVFVLADTAEAVPAGYGFTYKGVTVYMNGKADSLLKKAGKPSKKSESKSCAYAGMDRTYTYKDVIIKTYSKTRTGTEYVNSIELLSSSLKTKEGIKIGSSKNDVTKAYGKGSLRFGVYTFTKGKCRLMIEMNSRNKVSKITYLAK